MALNQPESEMPPETIKSYMEDYGVSYEEASRRLDAQLRAGDAFEQLESRLGENFAGLWFSNEDGQFIVPLLEDADRELVDQFFSGRGLSDAYRTNPATWSWAELHAAQVDIDEELFDVISDHQIATVPDVIHNSLVVAVSDSIPPEVQERVTSAVNSLKVDADIRVVDGKQLRPPTAQGACAFPDCNHPLRGGQEIYSSRECSSGFLVYGNVNGQRYIMTAGHCLQDTTSWWAQNVNNQQLGIGGVWNWMYGYRGDFGIIRVVADSPWNTPVGTWHPGVVYWFQQNFHYISNAQSSYKGLYVCHSGRSTGTSCGTVQEREMTVTFDRDDPYPDTPVGGIARMTGESLCTLRGDSGGSVFTNGYAVGIWNGGFQGCNINGYFSEINNAAPEMGTYLAIGPYS